MPRARNLTETAKKVGVHAHTILRWIHASKVKIALKKDHRGQYVFTPAEVNRLKAYKDTPKRMK